MATTLVLGATGMTGSHILSTLLSLANKDIASVTTICRRPPPHSDKPQLKAYIESDTSKWSSLVNNPAPAILFSSLATTRSTAGSFQTQYALEHDLNISLAQTARLHGSRTYVLISASSADPTSRIPYTRMKGEIERDILALNFPHTVILRPGLIGGRREESRPAEAVIRWIADGLGWISGGALKDFWTQDADVIGRAAVRAGLRAERGEMGAKTVLYGRDIMELGRGELTVEELGG